MLDVRTIGIPVGSSIGSFKGAFKRRAFKNYEDLFNYIVDIENSKLLDDKLFFAEMNWSFTTYSPRRVKHLYDHKTPSCEAIKEAVSEVLSLIEVCVGDYRTPTYIVVTPNVNMAYLKKRWCHEYCHAHSLIIKERVGMNSKEGASR